MLKQLNATGGRNCVCRLSPPVAQQQSLPETDCTRTARKIILPLWVFFQRSQKETRGLYQQGGFSEEKGMLFIHWWQTLEISVDGNAINLVSLSWKYLPWQLPFWKIVHKVAYVRGIRYIPDQISSPRFKNGFWSEIFAKDRTRLQLMENNYSKRRPEFSM